MSVLNTVRPDPSENASGTGTFAAVGVPVDQERIYGFLLERPGTAISAARRALAVTKDAAAKAIAGLLEKGLVVAEPGPVVRYRAVAPDVAIEALVVRQQEALARARHAASVLQERARQASAQRVDEAVTIEILANGLAARQRLWQAQITARRDVLFLGLTAFVSVLEQDQVPVEVSACLRRGVRHRSLVDREVFREPGALEALKSYVEVGGEVRVAAAPTRMMLVDGKTAVFPVYADGALSGATVVCSSALAEAFAALADVTWSHATSLIFAADGSVSELPIDLGERILPMLVAGCKDEAIARQVGVSTRTLDRRIRVLMDGLGAVTRFQAGWRAAQRFGRS